MCLKEPLSQNLLNSVQHKKASKMKQSIEKYKIIS